MSDPAASPAAHTSPNGTTHTNGVAHHPPPPFSIHSSPDSGREPTAGDSAANIVAALARAGINLVCSLPDKWLGGLLSAVDRSDAFTHLRVTREEEGLAICAGAYLGGRRGVTICQTAGLLLSVNTLAAHVHQHHFPQLILCAHRGTAEDSFFFQMYKGQVITGVLDAIPVKYLQAQSPADVGATIEQAARYADLQRAPVVVLLGKRVLVGTDAFG